ncbi:S41 family peptidase [Legionella sp. 16cNR16C]|uniref:S41 family peptidase n=1 Tax=Legionella sp. 16cNR16C TaxID=2905656 RepID=UPI001E4D73C1|nr:S41 family peptidase [Legionella sp. 16cNR16C]
MILHQIDYLPPVNRVNIPIVLLVDEGTGSSGAITAFALKENSSTSHILGERTSPTLSVNASLELKDGNYFNLMILRIVSADGIEQPLYLDIDTNAEHNFYSMFKPEDESIKLAIQYLTQPNYKR